MEKTLDQKYEELNVTELERRLKRPASQAEITNSDNDADLVNEVMWQLLKDLNARMTELEKRSIIIK